MRTSLLAVWCLLALTTYGSGQDGESRDSPRFRVESFSNLFEVRVVDAQGNSVRGLTRDDFRVRVDSKPSDILYFDELPRSPVSLAIMVDIGSSMGGEEVRAAKESVSQLIHLLDPEDEILLGVYGKEVEFLSELTTDRHQLVESIRNVSPGARPGFFARMAGAFGTGALTGLAIDESLLRLKKAQNEVRIVLVFSSAFGNLGPGTEDHLALSGARFFAVGWGNSAGDLLNLGGDKITRGRLLKQSGGLFHSGNSILERIEFLATSMKHYYLIAFEDPAGEDREDRGPKPEFVLPDCPECDVAFLRRVSSRNSVFY